MGNTPPVGHPGRAGSTGGSLPPHIPLATSSLGTVYAVPASSEGAPRRFQVIPALGMVSGGHALYARSTKGSGVLFVKGRTSHAKSEVLPELGAQPMQASPNSYNSRSLLAQGAQSVPSLAGDGSIPQPEARDIAVAPEHGVATPAAANPQSSLTVVPSSGAHQDDLGGDTREDERGRAHFRENQL